MNETETKFKRNREKSIAESSGQLKSKCFASFSFCWASKKKTKKVVENLQFQLAVLFVEFRQRALIVGKLLYAAAISCCSWKKRRRNEKKVCWSVTRQRKKKSWNFAKEYRTHVCTKKKSCKGSELQRKIKKSQGNFFTKTQKPKKNYFNSCTAKHFINHNLNSDVKKVSKTLTKIEGFKSLVRMLRSPAHIIGPTAASPTTTSGLFDSCHRKIRLIGGNPVAFLGGLMS